MITADHGPAVSGAHNTIVTGMGLTEAVGFGRRPSTFAYDNRPHVYVCLCLYIY